MFGFRFYESLCFGGWTASGGFNVVQLWQNCMSAYYLTLIMLKDAWTQRGSKCWLAFLPAATTKNMIRLLANLAVRLFSWPCNVSFEPSKTCEDAIEFFFGQVKTYKRGVAGTSTTANAIQSSQLIHLRQAQIVAQAGAIGGWTRMEGGMVGS